MHTRPESPDEPEITYMDCYDRSKIFVMVSWSTYHTLHVDTLIFRISMNCAFLLKLLNITDVS